MKLNNLLRRRIHLFGKMVPVWSLLLIVVVSTSAVITVILQKSVREEITVEAVGLDFVGIDASVLTNGLVTISFTTYEEATTTISQAYEIFNNNPSGLDHHMELSIRSLPLFCYLPCGREILTTPQTPTGSFPQLLSYSASIDGITFLSFDGSLWTTDFFGILNGASGIVAIDMVTGTGPGIMTIDQIYDLELINADLTQGTYTITSPGSHASGLINFTVSSLGDGDDYWVGHAPWENRTVDHVLANNGENITSVSLVGDMVIEYGDSADFMADFAQSLAGVTEYYLHIVETDEFLTWTPP